MMTENLVYDSLCSKKRSDILDGLYELSGVEKAPDENLINRVSQLLNHSDADIREQALSVLGVHWRSFSSFNDIFTLAKKEKDQVVLMSVCDALCSILIQQKDMGLSQQVSIFLKEIAFNEELDPELRGVAFLNLSRLNDKITPKEYAISPRDINDMDFPAPWLNSI